MRWKVELLTALSASQVHDLESACALGRNVAEKLLNQGAQKLLDLMRTVESSLGENPAKIKERLIQPFCWFLRHSVAGQEYLNRGFIFLLELDAVNRW